MAHAAASAGSASVRGARPSWAERHADLCRMLAAVEDARAAHRGACEALLRCTARPDYDHDLAARLAGEVRAAEEAWTGAREAARRAEVDLEDAADHPRRVYERNRRWDGAESAAA